MKLSNTGKRLIGADGKFKICSCCGCACSPVGEWLDLCDNEIAGLTSNNCAKEFNACITEAECTVTRHQYGSRPCDNVAVLLPFDYLETWSYVPTFTLPWLATGGGGATGVCSVATAEGFIDYEYKLVTSEYGQSNGCASPITSYTHTRSPDCYYMYCHCPKIGSGDGPPPIHILQWPYTTEMAQFFCMESGTTTSSETVDDVTTEIETTVSHDWSMTSSSVSIETTISKTTVITEETSPGVFATDTEEFTATYKFAYTYAVVLDCDDVPGSLSCPDALSSCDSNEELIPGVACPDQTIPDGTVPPYYLARNVTKCRVRNHDGICWQISPGTTSVLTSEMEEGGVIYYDVLDENAPSPTACCACTSSVGTNDCTSDTIQDFPCAPALATIEQECCCHPDDIITVEEFSTTQTLYNSDGSVFRITEYALTSPATGTRSTGVTFNVDIITTFPPGGPSTANNDYTIPANIPCAWNGSAYPGQYWWISPTSISPSVDESNGSCPETIEGDEVVWLNPETDYIFRKSCRKWSITQTHYKICNDGGSDYYCVKVEQNVIITVTPTGDCDSGCYGDEEVESPAPLMMRSASPVNPELEQRSSIKSSNTNSSGCSGCRRKKKENL